MLPVGIQSTVRKTSIKCLSFITSEDQEGQLKLPHEKIDAIRSLEVVQSTWQVVMHACKP